VHGENDALYGNESVLVEGTLITHFETPQVDVGSRDELSFCWWFPLHSFRPMLLATFQLEVYVAVLLRVSP